MRDYILLGISMFGFVVSLFLLFIGVKNSKHDRLKQFVFSTQDIYAQIVSDIENESRRIVISEKIKKIGGMVSKLIPSGTLEQLDIKILRAGLSDRINAEEIYAVKVILAFLLFGIVTSLTFIGAGIRGLLLSILSFVAGYHIPDGFIGQKLEARRREIDGNILLYCDVIAVACEAGLSLNEAVKKVCHSMGGALGDELLRTFGEIETGRDYETALRELQKRSPSETLNALADMLITAEKYGTPVAKVMREFTGQIRERRKQRVQELSQKAVVKMTFPVLIFILAPMLFLLISPAFVNLRYFFM